jgi:hypothetical protein
MLLRADLLVALVLLDACRFRSLLTREWHGPYLSMPTVGALLIGWRKPTGDVPTIAHRSRREETAVANLWTIVVSLART